MILLTPGPCMTSESVRLAGAVPDMNHREPAFQEIFSDVRQRLLSIYEGMDGWTACLIGGGGTAAVEAMIVSCTGPGKSLILVNGYFSARKAAIFGAHRKPHELRDFGWTAAIDLQWLRERMKVGDIDSVLVVHNETTTGRLNDVSEIGQICREHGVQCFVDSISSFGADLMDPSVLDAVVGSSNKCLHSIAGVSFVLLSPGAVHRVREARPYAYYLDLRNYLADSPSTTPPVPAISALRVALREFPGLSERNRLYAERAEFIRSALAKRGFEAVIRTSQSSVALTTYYVPAPYKPETWIAANRGRGYLLYGCKGELKDRCFQVANMGELTRDQLAQWIENVDQLLATG